MINGNNTLQSIYLTPIYFENNNVQKKDLEGESLQK